MNCRNASQSISAYLDGELTGTTMLELSRHLQECPSCQSELESMRHIKSMLGKMSMVAPSADFEARLAEKVWESAKTVRQPARLWPSAMVALVAGATVVWVALIANPKTTVVASGMELRTVEPAAQDRAITAMQDPLSGQAPIVSVRYEK